jgi:O-acetyl-ADP-ribose deacetylase (regulator of RNase III)
MTVRIVSGDLLEQDVEAIVNPWNRNIIPWWLLLPHGVSGAVKKKAGLAPFWEVGWKGPIPLGGAVATGAGRLPYKAIIHVTGINGFWKASEKSIRDSVHNALALAEKLELRSLAFPLIGSGAGGFSPEKAEEVMLRAFEESDSLVAVTLVKWSGEKR